MIILIVIPPEYKEVYDKSKGKKGFMGISLGKTIFQNPKIMKEYAEFYSNHYNEFFFLLGDDIKIYNYLAITGMSEERAEERLKEERRNTMFFLDKIISKYENVSMNLWRDSVSSEYLNNLKIIKEGYEENESFKEGVRGVTRRFLSTPNNLRKLKKHRTIEEATDIAKDYFLYELAMLNAIHYKYPGIYENYPGSIPLEREVQNNEYEFCKKLYKAEKSNFFEVYYKDTPLQIAFEEV